MPTARATRENRGAQPTGIRIMLADDHLLMLEALAETLNLVPDFDVVEIVHQRQEIIPVVLRALPAVVVLGFGLTGHDGLPLAAEIRSRLPSCAVVVTVGQPTRALVDRAIEVGVLSVIPTHARLPQLIDAVRGVAAGCLIIDSDLLRTPAAHGRCLSDREREILRLAATGASIKDIAGELFLAPGTVRNLTSAAIKKLDARNRFDAARIAGEQGWL